MRFFSTLLGLWLSITTFSQSPVKFGKISPTDLEKKFYSIDTSAHAVVISETGSTEIVGNTKGWFSLEFKMYKRIHILNKNAYDEATVEIPLYMDGSQTEKLDNIKGVTYNLENGKIIETKLEKSAVFTENRSKKFLLKKFTLPNVKEGSIIEFEYRITSDFLFNLQPWSFQGSSPRLWSEYTVALPQFLNYIFLGQGYHPFHIKNTKNRQGQYIIISSEGASASERYTLNSGITDYKWVMKDVPTLKIESYTSSLKNHISRIEFQLNAFQYPLNPRNIMGSWPQLTKELLEDDDFGRKLSTANNWMNDEIKPLLAGISGDFEKAKKIYAFVRDNITCTDHTSIKGSQTLKNVLKTKNGNVSDLNLLMTAMLRDAGIKADPVLLATREHGYTYPLYPLMDRFNYVITKAEINGVTYFLDASHPKLGFGKLLANCYNGHARIINESATAIEFQPDSLKEKELTAVFISHDEKGNWIGSMIHNPGYLESYSMRKKIQEQGKDVFFKNLQKDFGADITIKNPKIDSLAYFDLPIKIEYGFTVNLEKEDIIYLNPVLSGGYKENPFKSAERLYPVEMPYTFDETYIASIEVPKGYDVDEMPKSVRVKLNDEGEGSFEYLLTQSGSTISMRIKLKMSRAYFAPEEYDLLREFFNLIVSKQKEQIVFKKKA